MTDITNLFELDSIDHHEFLALLTLRYNSCWRVSEHEVSFPASDDYRVMLEMHHGQITKISSSDALSQKELTELLEQVEGDLKDERIAEYGAEILFAHWPVTGAFRFSSLPMQILPAPPEASRPPHITADHPFVLEYPIKAYKTPDIRNMRRRKNAVEWAWVLNAMLRGSVSYSSSRPRQLWAIESGAPDRQFWAREFYMVAGFQGILSELSAIEQRDSLSLFPAQSYFGDAKARANLPLDIFFLPDNLDALVTAFIKLNSEKRRRFLRSAAAIYMAGQLWESSISSFLLACVQAIETLVDRTPQKPCATCGKDTGPGPTRLFREFVEKHCVSSDVDPSVVKKLYSVRSDLAHGRYLFQLDEAPWAFGLGATVASHHELEMSRTALTLAKDGLRNWLLS